MILDDIIAAVATARGVAGVAIVRLSGPGSFALARKFFKAHAGGEITPRQMTFGAFVNANGDPVDEGYFVHLPAPKTFTGQEIVELHTHGGLAAPAAVLSLLADAGARMAEPGEFTRRALASGRIDLAQAESLLDVVHARSEAALRAAHARLSGALSGRLRTLRDRLIDAKALIEAQIDFEDAETGDIDPKEISALLRSAGDDLAALVGTYRKGRIYRDGALAVITGRPNVGKSSLCNALVGRRRSIVSETPGTTRDAVEVDAVLDGAPFRLVDTAGLRETAGDIEREGMLIAHEHMAQADMIVFLIDARQGWTNEDRALRAQLPDVPIIITANKSDLLKDGEKAVETPISALTGRGLSDLTQKMVGAALGVQAGSVEEGLLANERHHQEARAARDRVAAALIAFEQNESPAIVALEVHDALRALSEILGDTTPDDVLGRIFSRFCVGK
jgi:tRNA modification GTPase